MPKAIRMTAQGESREVPAGTGQGLFRFTLQGPAGFAKSIEDGGLQVTIPIPGPGVYNAKVETLDASGNILHRVANEITVPADAPVAMETVVVAAGLSLSVVDV